MNGAAPIPFSRTDLERQRLESTLDNDLSTLSLGASNPSTSFASHSSVSTIGVPRSAAVHDYRPTLTFDETPRRPGRHPSFAASFASAGVGASPTSTDGHHVSAATLGAGVFNNPTHREATGDFDPDRSLGRLVGQLTRAMEDEVRSPLYQFRDKLTPAHHQQARVAVPGHLAALTHPSPEPTAKPLLHARPE